MYSPLLHRIYNDAAFAVIHKSVSTLADIFSVGGQNGTTGWQTFSYTAASAGTYTIGVAGLNSGDNIYNSHIAIDNVAAVSPVPEPATLLLLGTGLIGLAARRRWQRAA